MVKDLVAGKAAPKGDEGKGDSEDASIIKRELKLFLAADSRHVKQKLRDKWCEM